MPRMKREDWTALALVVLAEEGPEALTVATLCERAGRTRGSMYHHFSDHGALLDATMEAWTERCTEDLIEATPPGPQAASSLHELAMAIEPALERAVRRLAERVPRLRARVQEVDRRRMEHIAALHGGGEDARALAEIEYAAFVGFQHLELPAERMEILYRWFRERVG